jgi:hypothetical protein
MILLISLVLRNGDLVRIIDSEKNSDIKMLKKLFLRFSNPTVTKNWG